MRDCAGEKGGGSRRAPSEQRVQRQPSVNMRTHARYSLGVFLDGTEHDQDNSSLMPKLSSLLARLGFLRFAVLLLVFSLSGVHAPLD